MHSLNFLFGQAPTTKRDGDCDFLCDKFLSVRVYVWEFLDGSWKEWGKGNAQIIKIYVLLLFLVLVWSLRLFFEVLDCSCSELGILPWSWSLHFLLQRHQDFRYVGETGMKHMFWIGVVLCITLHNIEHSHDTLWFIR